MIENKALRVVVFSAIGFTLGTIMQLTVPCSI